MPIVMVRMSRCSSSIILMVSRISFVLIIDIIQLTSLARSGSDFVHRVEDVLVHGVNLHAELLTILVKQVDERVEVYGALINVYQMTIANTSSITF